MNLFSLDPGLTIWTWVAFGILCFILAKWVFPNLLQALHDRETLLARSVDTAAALEARLRDLEAERQALLQQTRGEAEALMKQARDQAEVLKKELREQAQAEAAALVEQGRVQLADERRAAVEALRAELADFVLVCAGTIVGSTLQGERERQWSRDLVKTL